ncbi:MAG: shikimate kinase [Streptosporangiaceae bacterium]
MPSGSPPTGTGPGTRERVSVLRVPALDKPLTDKQRAELRELSSRAEITATRFVNEYSYGDFRGRPEKLIERYFDAFLCPDIAGTAPGRPPDRRCGGEESELRVSLVGVSCVGTTTIGRILAERRGWPFFDLDDEIERHFGISIERLQARFLTSYDYRKECAVVLEHIATANPDCVIALPPSGLRDAFLRVVRRVPGVTVAVHDAPGNILERITFYDIDSRRIQKHLSGEERILYLKEIKADISYFKRSYERADLQVTITGLDPEASAAAIDARLGRT